MKNKSFLSEINKELNNGCDVQKVVDMEHEAMNYYSNKISDSLNAMSLGDVPYAIAALEHLSKNLRKTFPAAGCYADELEKSTNTEFTIIHANKNVFEELL